jgi:hypothetical protein
MVRMGREKGAVLYKDDNLEISVLAFDALKKHKCKNCGKEFKTSVLAIFCSDKCGRNHKRRLNNAFT